MLKRLFIIGLCSISAFSYADVKPYKISDSMFTSIAPNRIKSVVWISSPEAKTQRDRLDTISEATAALLLSGRKVDALSVYLIPNKKFVGTGYNLASFDFFLDRCGYDGDKCDGILYKARASSQKLTDQQIKIAEMILVNEASIPEDQKLAHIAKTLKISESKVLDNYVPLRLQLIIEEKN